MNYKFITETEENVNSHACGEDDDVEMYIQEQSHRHSPIEMVIYRMMKRIKE